MARVSTKFLTRPPYTRLWDRIPRVLWDTLADESFSPRQTDGELLVGQGDQVVPTDYFNGLVASAAGRLPQPLAAADVGQPMVPPPGDGGWQAE